MKCKNAKILISEYIDGELDATRGAALERHLDECAGCRRIYRDLSRIVSAAGVVEDPIPAENTWRKIEARMILEPSSSRSDSPLERRRGLLPGFRWAAAAAAVLVIVGALVLGPRMLRRGPDALDAAAGRDFTLAKLEEAERHYQSAIRALADAAEGKEGQLDPKLAEVFRSNLELINMSISACREAVLSDPSDLESRKYLLAAYREKAELLNRILYLNGGLSQTGKAKTI